MCGEECESKMADILTTVVSLFTAAGFGGVLGAYFQARFQQRSKFRKLRVAECRGIRESAGS